MRAGRGKRAPPPLGSPGRTRPEKRPREQVRGAQGEASVPPGDAQRENRANLRAAKAQEQEAQQQQQQQAQEQNGVPRSGLSKGAVKVQGSQDKARGPGRREPSAATATAAPAAAARAARAAAAAAGSGGRRAAPSTGASSAGLPGPTQSPQKVGTEGTLQTWRARGAEGPAGAPGGAVTRANSKAGSVGRGKAQGKGKGKGKARAGPTPPGPAIPTVSPSRGAMAEEEDGGVPPEVVVVTHASQLPPRFLSPSGRGSQGSAGALVVGFDCEGIGLSRHGRLCVMQLAMEGVVYLVDAVSGGEELMEACRPGLESPEVVKVVHDCRRDAEALFFQFGIKVQGIFDIQVAHFLIDGSRESDGISFVQLLARPEYCGAVYGEKEAMRQKLNEEPEWWLQRPWTEAMLKAASDDVRYLPQVHARMLPLLTPAQLRTLAVRSALRSASFCCSSSEDSLAWPRALPFPHTTTTPANDGTPAAPCAQDEEVEGAAREEPQWESDESDDRLAVVDIPPGKMGCVIGRKGASIKALREACPHMDVFTGSMKGPMDKVFLIGPKSEVQMAEAIVRGKFS